MHKFIYQPNKLESGAFTPITTLEMEVKEDATIEEMLTAFEDYLRGVGYIVDYDEGIRLVSLFED